MAEENMAAGDIQLTIAQPASLLRQTRAAGLEGILNPIGGPSRVEGGGPWWVFASLTAASGIRALFRVGVAIGIGYRKGIIPPAPDSNTDGDLISLTFVVSPKGLFGRHPWCAPPCQEA